jgi:hypothetical protein
MGQIFSRLNNPLNNNNAVEENEVVQNYRYPPKSGKKVLSIAQKWISKIFLSLGNFFSSSFIMGGDRHDQSIPESYLFGENSDLNWLAPKPTAVINQKIVKNYLCQ